MKKYIHTLSLVLVAIVFTTMQAHAQISFEFTEESPTSIRVTGTGSATTGAAGMSGSVGFSDDFQPTGPLFTNPATPAEWAVNPIDRSGFGGVVPMGTLNINGNAANFWEYRSGPGNPEWLYINFTAGIPANTLVTASGSTVFSDGSFGMDIPDLFTFYTPGTKLTVIPGVLHFCIGGPCATAVTPVTPVVHRRSSNPTLFVADTLAINSVMYSALPFGQAQLGALQQAVNTIGPGINARLFRARANLNPIPTDGFEPNNTNGWLRRAIQSRYRSGVSTGSSSLLRHLAFVGDENMSYKVALGLADPEERTVEVNMVDTLSAQAGTNLNGQSLGGGLPYAMMGVPMMPMAGGAATVRIVEAAPSSKTVIEDSKAVIENEVWNRWELYVAGDFSFYDQDQLTDLMQGFDTNTYAGSVGVEYRALDWLNLGLAWSYLESDTNVSGNLGDIDLEGNLISGYATVFWRQYWADILYTYGTFDNDLRRNTGLGSSARGDTDSDSHNIRLNFGRNFNIGSDVVTGPIAGLRYSMGDIDPYSETGGGRAAVDYDGSDFESMISRLGWQATHFRSTNWGRLISQAHLAWEHEYMPESGTVGASLQTSPFALVTGSNVRRVGGFSAEDDGAHPGTDWLSAGAGVRFELSSGVSVNADYEGVFFRSNSSQHYASAKLSYEWGTFMPNGGAKGSGESGSGKAVAYEAYDASSEKVAAAKPAPAPEPVVTETAEVSESPQKKSGFFSKFGKKKKSSGYVPYSEPVTAVKSTPEPIASETPSPKPNAANDKVTSNSRKSDFSSWLASKGR